MLNSGCPTIRFTFGAAGIVLAIKIAVLDARSLPLCEARCAFKENGNQTAELPCVQHLTCEAKGRIEMNLVRDALVHSSVFAGMHHLHRVLATHREELVFTTMAPMD